MATVVVCLHAYMFITASDTINIPLNYPIHLNRLYNVHRTSCHKILYM